MDMNLCNQTNIELNKEPSGAELVSRYSASLPVDERCLLCLQNSYERLMVKFSFSEEQRAQFRDQYNRITQDGSIKIGHKKQRELSGEFRKVAGVDDLYASEKELSNRIALELYKSWKPRLSSFSNPKMISLRLAIAGNIMDYGVHHEFDIEKTLNSVITSSLAIDHSSELLKAVHEAKAILIIGDNAGEIVFDKLMIETLKPQKVYYAVRGGVVLNDATMRDAVEVGMDSIAEVISNGYNAPATILSACSQEFLDVFNGVELIIAKGQGNFESLFGLGDPRIFHLLMAKCHVVAEYLDVPKGSYIIVKQGLKNFQVSSE